MAYQEANAETPITAYRGLPPEIMQLPLRTRAVYAKSCRDCADFREQINDYLWLENKTGGLSPRERFELAELKTQLNNAARTKVQIEAIAGIL